MKQNWRRFKGSRPGHRFRDRYRRRQESEHGWRDPSRLFYVLGGLVLAVGSLLLGVLPGPGMLTFFVGLGTIAGEFGPVARLLDWAEVWARVSAKRVGGHLEIERRGQDLGRLGGRDSCRRGPLRSLPLALRWLTSSLIHPSAGKEDSANFALMGF